MRDEQTQMQEIGGRIGWDVVASEPTSTAYPVVLEAVDARAGGAATRRIFRGRLHNRGGATVAVTLEVALPAPFLPSAAVLMQRLFTMMPGETLRVELGSTVGAAPSADEVRQAAQLRVA